MATTTLILGGGVGGIATANRLRRRLGRDHRIILVNREPDFTHAASLPWVATGSRTLSQVTRPLERLRRRGIEVTIGTIEGVDPVNRTAVVNGREVSGDHLVIALGAEHTVAHVPGLAEHGTTFATPEGALATARALSTLDRGDLVILTAAPLYRCPAAPYEMALLADAALRRRGVRDRVRVALRAAESAPMGVAGPEVSDGVRGLLASRDIDYKAGRQATEAGDGSVSFADRSADAFDALVFMPGIAPPPVLALAGLAADGGWLSADRHTLATEHPSVWAIGDNVSIPLTMGKPLPRAGVFAHRQGHVVADAIAAQVRGRATTSRFEGRGACFVETGYGRAAYGSGDFYAEPAPSVALRRPGRIWHGGKVLLERQVLRGWL